MSGLDASIGPSQAECIMERFIVGRSEDVEAEYAYRADSPVTLLFLADDEPVSVEGFSTVEAARSALRRDGVAPSQIEYVG